MTATENTKGFIVPAISSRLIRELPRFFGGAEAMFKEAFQNASRAGATQVEIWQDGNRVTITDNGVGLSDPQVLFTGGDTGWNEQAVIEPAGLGVFSYLNPEITERVAFSSRDWRVQVTPDILERPIGEEAVQGGQEHLSGFRVELSLKGAVVTHLGALRRARGMFPFEVTLNGETVKREGFTTLASAVTPFGKLTLVPHNTSLRSHAEEPRYQGTPEVFLIWEHQVIRDSVLEGRLAKALRDKDAALTTFRFVWEASVDGGMRPKLPDRNAWLQNAALEAAFREIVQLAPALVEALTVEAEVAAAGLPDTLLLGDLPRPVRRLLRAGGFGSGVSRVRARRLGFSFETVGSYSEAATVSVYDDGGDGYTEGLSETWGLRRLGSGLAVQDDIVVDTLNAAAVTLHPEFGGITGGFPAFPFKKGGTQDDGGAELVMMRGETPVELDDLNEQLLVDWVTSIEVGGESLPFLIQSCAPYVVIAAPSWDEATVDDWMAAHILDCASENGLSDAYYYVYGESADEGFSVSSDDVVERAHEQLEYTYSGKADVIDAVEQATKNLERAERALEALKGVYGQQVVPGSEAAIEALGVVVKQLTDHREDLRKQL